jgi:hypothetical protein
MPPGNFHSIRDTTHTGRAILSAGTEWANHASVCDFACSVPAGGICADPPGPLEEEETSASSLAGERQKMAKTEPKHQNKA